MYLVSTLLILLIGSLSLLETNGFSIYNDNNTRPLCCDSSQISVIIMMGGMAGLIIIGYIIYNCKCVRDWRQRVSYDRLF